MEVKADVLQKALKVVKPAIERKSSLQELKSILFEPLDNSTEIYATNLEQWVKVVIPSCVVDKPTVVADGLTFISKIDTFDKEETIELFNKDDLFYVKSSTAKFRFPTYFEGGFPRVGLDNGLLKLPNLSEKSEKLIHYMSQVSSATSKDIEKPALRGVVLYPKDDLLYIVGSDGYRLHMISVENTYGITKQMIIPASAVRILDTALTLDGIEYTIWTRKYDNEYPNFFNVIPNQDAFKLVVYYDVKYLREAISTILLDTVSTVVFDIGPDKTVVSTQSVEKGDAEYLIYQEAEGTIKNLKIAFNSKYLLDALSFIHDWYAKFEFIDSDSVLKISQAPKTALVMPLRL